MLKRALGLFGHRIDVLCKLRLALIQTCSVNLQKPTSVLSGFAP